MSFLDLKSLLYVEVLICLGYGVFLMALSKRWRTIVGFRPLILVGTMTAAAFLAPNLLILNLICLPLIPLLAKNAEEVALYLIVGLFTAPELPFNLFAGSLKLIPYSLSATLSLGALFTLMLRRKRPLRPVSAADIPFLALVPLLWFAAARDSSATHVLREGANVLVSVVVPYFVITRGINSTEGFQKLLVWIVAAAAMLVIVLIYERMVSWPLYASLSDRYDVSTPIFVKSRFGQLRAFGPLGEATRMGFLLVIGFAAAMVSRSAFAFKEFHLGMIAIVGLALWAPQSRGALLGAAIVFACVILYRARGGILLSLSMAALGASAITIMALVRTEEDAHAASTLEYRELLWTRGLEEFWKYPLTGTSRVDAIYRLRDLYQGEGQVDIVNSYLYFALTAGAMGAFVLLITLALPAVKAWLARSNWQFQSVEHRIGAYVFAISISAAVMFFFTGFLGRPALLVLALTGLGMSQIAGSRRRTGRGPTSQLYRLVVEPAQSRE